MEFAALETHAKGRLAGAAVADEDELDGVRGGGAGAAGAAVELAEVGEDLGVVGTRERRGDARVLAEVDAVECGEGEVGGRRGGAGEEGRLGCGKLIRPGSPFELLQVVSICIPSISVFHLNNCWSLPF